MHKQMQAHLCNRARGNFVLVFLFGHLSSLGRFINKRLSYNCASFTVKYAHLRGGRTQRPGHVVHAHPAGT